MIVVVVVKPSEEPVTVTVTVPVDAVLLAVRVSELVVAVLPGLNEAVTPVGRPEADKVTLPLKPLCGVTVIALAPLEPCLIVRLLGEAERVKFGGGFTVSETVVAFVKLPTVPVMATATVPVAAVPLALSVSVLVVPVVPGVERGSHAGGQAGGRQTDVAIETALWSDRDRACAAGSLDDGQTAWRCGQRVVPLRVHGERKGRGVC